MAIGVSFMGYDGKAKQEVAHSLADLKSIMSGKVAPVPGAPQIGQTFGAKAKKEIEPPDPIDGPLVGVRGNKSIEPDGQSRNVGSKGGFRIPVTRTDMELEEYPDKKYDKLTLVKLEFDLIFSEKGFCKGRSEEYVVWKQSFYVARSNEKKKEEEEGSGECCVRAFWDKETTDRPKLQALAFGSDSDLDTFVPDKGDFAANYNDEAMTKKKQVPPVKIITTAECGYKPI